MRFIKNKYFIVTVCIAILLCVVPTVIALIGGQDYLRTGVNLAAKPFRSVINFAVDGVNGFAEYFRGVDELLRENEALRAELEKYKQDGARADLLEKENDRLRNELGFADSLTEYTLQDASVTGRSSNSYSTTYTLNRGSECGIEVNMAVITPDGVAGYIKEVGIGWSRAVAITDPTSVVGAYSASGIYGSVEGSVRYRTDGYCVMNTSAAGITVGTQIYSSGYGNIYPEGLPIGKVISSEKDKYSHVTTYVIDPAVDFDSLTSVLIVKSKTVLPEADNVG